MIAEITVFLVLFVVSDQPVVSSTGARIFTFALALAVGLTPELLPMIVSVTLARGALRMSKKQVIVKRLSAIDDLGSMDVLCSDKTGTLTEARIKLVREVDLGGQDSDAVMQLAQLNAAFETGLKSPLDDAILAAGKIDLDGLAQDRRGAVRFRASPGLCASRGRRPPSHHRQGRAGRHSRASRPILSSKVGRRARSTPRRAKPRGDIRGLAPRATGPGRRLA